MPLALRAGLRALDGHRLRDMVVAAAWIVGAAYVWWWYGGLAMAILCMLIFSFGIGLPIPIVGPWLRGLA